MFSKKPPIFYHFSHRRQVPDITDDAPRGHHPPEVLPVGLLRTVPERVRQSAVVLHRDRVDRRTDLECSGITRKKLSKF